MASRRPVLLEEALSGEKLTAALVGIGMQLAAAPARNANIEDTLLAAAIDAMEHDDLRVLSILVTWLATHAAWINADRLRRAIAAQESKRVRAFWLATAWQVRRAAALLGGGAQG